MKSTAINKIIEWLPIAVTGGVYIVSSNGDIRRNCQGCGVNLKPQQIRGYYACTPSIGNKKIPIRVHREVAKAFLPNPLNKPQVNHKDGDKLNNSVGNLEWATAQENSIHAVKTGLNKSVGEGHPMSKLTKEQVLAIRGIWACKQASQTQLAAAFKVGRSTIGDIVRRTKWKSI